MQASDIPVSTDAWLRIIEAIEATCETAERHGIVGECAAAVRPPPEKEEEPADGGKRYHSVRSWRMRPPGSPPAPSETNTRGG